MRLLICPVFEVQRSLTFFSVSTSLLFETIGTLHVIQNVCVLGELYVRKNMHMRVFPLQTVLCINLVRTYVRRSSS